MSRAKTQRRKEGHMIGFLDGLATWRETNVENVAKLLEGE